jgi:small conductance mechanosensitive channel
MKADLLVVDVEDLFYFVMLIVITLFLSRAVYVLIRRVLDIRTSKRRSKTNARAAQYIIIALGLSYGMTNILHFDIATAAATLGIVSIVIALASQQILQNLMAGILMGMERQIQLEDWVDIGGSPDTKPARVRDITLTKTILLDPTGKLVIVPNSIIVNSKIINYTKAGFFEVSQRLTVSLNEDIGNVVRIILEVADSDPYILPDVPDQEKQEVKRVMGLRHLRSLFENTMSLDMFKPRVLVADISDGKVTLSIRIWIREVYRRDDIVSDFLGNLHSRLHQEEVQLV